MGLNIAQKLIKSHLVSGEMIPGKEISIKIDQTLTQDATGTMAYLQFEAMGIDKVKTELSLSYIDHNTLQSGFENADDHKYIQTVCKKHGVYFSKPGNGICHQLHLEMCIRDSPYISGRCRENACRYLRDPLPPEERRSRRAKARRRRNGREALFRAEFQLRPK